LGSETPRTKTASYGIRAKKKWPKKDYRDKSQPKTLSLKIQQKKFYLLAHQSTARTSRMMQNHTFSPTFFEAQNVKVKVLSEINTSGVHFILFFDPAGESC
jgi:hypothetical protein